MSNVLPDYSLDDYEIRDTLNEHGGVTDNVFGSKFRTTAQIDKWSKKKPVRYAAMFVDGTEDPPYWKAYNGFCGFAEDSVMFRVLENLVAAVEKGNIFVYELPTGDPYFYRMGDFRSYNPKAKSPIWSFEASGQIDLNAANTTYATFTILGDNDIDEETNLTLQDIIPTSAISLSEYYFGVVVVKNGSIVKSEVLSERIDNGKGWTKSVSVSSEGFKDIGDYMAYAMLVSPDGKKFVPCPITGAPFKVIATNLSSKLGWYEDASEEYNYYVQIGGRKNFYGRLAYFNGEDNTVSFEGMRPTIYAKVYHKDGTSETLTYETITLVKTESNGNVNYMDVELSAKSSTQDGDRFTLEVAFNTGSYHYGEEITVNSNSNIEQPLNNEEG